jgi:hypothetical protein
MVALAHSPTQASGLYANARHSRTLDQVREEVAVRSSFAFPDVTLPLSALHVTEEGLFEVPEVGALDLTPWSRAQLSRMLGIRWDRWFSSIVSPRERKEELERRLSRLDGDWKIRSRRHLPDESGAGNGVVRAFLGATYTAIDDERVIERLTRVLRGRSDSFRFLRTDVTDRSSYYVAVNMDEVDLGNGQPDYHWNGFVIVNSEVGHCALSLLEYLVRLVCANGLVVFGHGQKIFHRIHRATEDESLDRDLAYAFTRLPDHWSDTTHALRSARADVIEQPETYLTTLLTDDPTVRPHTEGVLAAWRTEPDPTRFGLIQALTRTAQALAPDERFLLERFAGRLLPFAEA